MYELFLEALVLASQTSEHDRVYGERLRGRGYGGLKLTAAVGNQGHEQAEGEYRTYNDANIREFTNDMERVFYFPQPVNVPVKGFFEDGIHPSEQGYADWAEAMIKHFAANHEW